MGKWPLNLRKTIQSVWAVLTNGYIIGFFQGRIYNGKLKTVCVPGLNCYSCPGSLGSCPIGSLQAVLSSARFHISFYLFGFFLLVGTFLGRLVCGFLCPFGLIQELLHKIPFWRKIATFRFDRTLRRLKYVILVLFVILLPMLAVDVVGTGSPAFCKWLCPAGTLEGGIPLLLTNPSLRSAAGFLFQWKMLILLLTIVASIIIYRPFCKYICPLGAIYALFNKFSVYRYDVSEEKCTGCRKCENSCPMQINPRTEVNHPECIRCGSCKGACRHDAISSGFCLKAADSKNQKIGIN